MNWLYLLFAGCMEVTWAVSLKISQGFTKLVPSIVTVVSGLLGVIFLSLAMRTIPMGTAYAVWTGIGVVGTAVLGIFLFGESTSPGRMLAFCLVISGIVLLKLFDK